MKRHTYRERPSVPPSLPPMSATLEEELSKAKRAYNLILELQPIGKYKPDIRNTIFHALSDVSVEHFGSIICLIDRRQNTGSALALLRPLIETYLRSAWTLNTASEDQLSQIAKGKKNFPGFEQCRSSAAAFFAKGGTKDLYNMSDGFVDNLHGFTHSGVEQVINRVGPKLEITPYGYPDALKSRLLDTAARFAVQSAILAIQHVDGTHNTLAPRVGALERRFNEIRSSQVTSSSGSQKCT